MNNMRVDIMYDIKIGCQEPKKGIQIIFDQTE